MVIKRAKFAAGVHTLRAVTRPDVAPWPEGQDGLSTQCPALDLLSSDVSTLFYWFLLVSTIFC